MQCKKTIRRWISRGGVLAVALLLPGLVLAVGFTNPLGKTATFSSFLVNVTRYLLGLVGFATMLAIVWGGIMYILSLGDDSRVQHAKKILLWAVIGLSVVVLSYVIIKTVSSLLGVPI